MIARHHGPTGRTYLTLGGDSSTVWTKGRNMSATYAPGPPSAAMLALEIWAQANGTVVRDATGWICRLHLVE